jgi:pyrroline-5-carboxylate reductase
MQLGFIGAGNMASALARGLGEPVLVFDPDTARAQALAEVTGGEALGSGGEVASRADAVVLCHKPWQLEEVGREVGGAARVVISILGATQTSAIEQAFPGVPVYRFIPNIPVEQGRGVLCYAAGSRAAEGPEDEVLRHFRKAGTVIPLDEPLLEPAMALMSCGPAFISLIVESFADAGAAHGLDRTDAVRMTLATMVGTAAHLSAHDLDLEELRAKVATPGGVTEKGLITLEERGVRDVCRAAVDTVVEATR